MFGGLNKTMFRDSFLLLQQEGSLIRTLIAQGLTSLRSANVNKKGDYYAAFFGLSIGLERLLKVIIILDYMARNDLRAPTGLMVKKSGGRSGHDLLELLKNTCLITTKAAAHPLASLVPSSLEYEIIKHLSDFGESCGRYANLEALASGHAQLDPLCEWKTIVVKILETDVSTRRKEVVRTQATALAKDISHFTLARSHDLDGQQLSLQELVETTWMTDLAANRAVLRIFRILGPLRNLLEDVNDRVLTENHRLDSEHAPVPFMHEFLDFVENDDKIILRKKRWP
jgi:hypothetical protein